jgi:predicted N-acyltransferase
MIATFHRRLDEIDAVAWDALRADDNPFLAHAFLAGLERHGCILSRLGWQPHHLALRDGDRLVAAAPLYLKGNSHGEFVFDWSWAEAYERHGHDYYPKLLAAVPYSPVTGPRLLAGNDDALAALCAQAIRAECERLSLSSAHANFVTEPQTGAFAGWLPRYDWQFHWVRRGWRNFDEFLDALAAKKRKNIRQERALVARAGVELVRVRGDAMTADDVDFVHACYRATFDEKGNYPALTREFFGHLVESMPRNVMAAIAYLDGRRVAMALFLNSSTTLYGRYWGALEHVPGLHFEACYYQGIEYCLEHGLERFEPGAQGEHKLARGFLPQRTRSFHYVADPRFREAIARALTVEAQHRADDGEELLRHSPYRETMEA